MKKLAYILLLIITLVSTAYTGYYTFLQYQDNQIVESLTLTATSTLRTVEVLPPNTLKTSTGKTIQVLDTHPSGQSQSTIIITPHGFIDSTPITLEKNKLTNFFLADLNKDGYDELIITTQASGSGSYGDVSIYTTAGDQALAKVIIQEVQEEDTKKGGLFEGYQGHDSFNLFNGVLTREFPIYTKEAMNATSSLPTRKLLYSLVEEDGTYAVVLTDASSTKNTPLLMSATSTLATTTLLLHSTTTHATSTPKK